MSLDCWLWKSAQVCDSTILQTGFDLPRQQWSQLNHFHTEQGHCGASAEINGNLQTLICVLVARPRRCPTLLNFVPWQNWMAAYLGYTLQMKTLFRGWPVMVYDMHTKRRRKRLDCVGLLHSFNTAWSGGRIHTGSEHIYELITNTCHWYFKL